MAKNFCQGSSKCISRVLSKILRKNDKSSLYYYHLFWDFECVYFWFWQKNSQVCRNSNLSVQSKNFEKNTLEQLVFRLFRTLTRKTCIFTGKFLVGLSKLLFTCPEKHLRSNISETKSWKLGDFRIIFEIFRTMAENIFQVWQNNNRCPEGTDYWKTFSKEKTSLFFPFLSEFLLWA